jgi:hypothetical protein
MTPEGDWELIRGSDGGLTGVASKARGQPMKLKGFTDENRAFEDADCYCDWRFVYLPLSQQRPGRPTATPLKLTPASPGSGARRQ